MNRVSPVSCPQVFAVLVRFTPPPWADSPLARLDARSVSAIVTAFGSVTSHAAILARSLGIPAVVGAGEGVLAVPDGTILAVDGTNGIVVVDPDPAVSAASGGRIRPAAPAAPARVCRRRFLVGTLAAAALASIPLPTPFSPGRA